MMIQGFDRRGDADGNCRRGSWVMVHNGVLGMGRRARRIQCCT